MLLLAISVLFNVFHYFCLLGWLLTPDSRPDFDDLHNRLNNMLSDPGRYILTVVSKNILQWLFQNIRKLALSMHANDLLYIMHYVDLLQLDACHSLSSVFC